MLGKLGIGTVWCQKGRVRVITLVYRKALVNLVSGRSREKRRYRQYNKKSGSFLGNEREGKAVQLGDTNSVCHIALQTCLYFHFHKCHDNLDSQYLCIS